MRASNGDLTHPSWQRHDEPRSSPRESLMSQMVRAQLIFDRRTPATGIPAWRDASDATPVSVDLRVGDAREPAIEPAAEGVTEDDPDGGVPMSFAQELAERLQLARERVVAEHDHLAQVGSVAAAYLGRPRLKLVK